MAGSQDVSTPKQTTTGAEAAAPAPALPVSEDASIAPIKTGFFGKMYNFGTKILAGIHKFNLYDHVKDVLYSIGLAFVVFDYVGEGLADFFGITTPRYQFVLDAYERHCDEVEQHNMTDLCKLRWF